MLISFRFENFKSFKDGTELDFKASKAKDRIADVVRIGNSKILPTASIFGANASGKSNVLLAFQFMKQYVMDSFGYNESDMADSSSAVKKPLFTPFLFSNDSREGKSTFEVTFIPDTEKCVTYQYGFTLSSKRVESEWLRQKAKSAREFKDVFSRTAEKGVLFYVFKDVKFDNINSFLGKQSLYVSFGAKLNIGLMREIHDWFSCISFVNYGDPMESALRSQIFPTGMPDLKKFIKPLVTFLSYIDTGIVNMDVKELEASEDGKPRYKIESLHKMEDSDELVALPIISESAGTLKMITLFPEIMLSLLSGGVLCVDELNAKLHPLLVKKIIETFSNQESNPRHAQIIFTTHDPAIMSKNVLRKDEIWLIDKDELGRSHLVSLTNVEARKGGRVRNDANYEREYNLGEYGAIPNLKDFNFYEMVNSFHDEETEDTSDNT